MLESDISSTSVHTFLSISWDTVNKKYVLGIRVHYGSGHPAIETIYIDLQVVFLIFQRLPEVISLLNKFSHFHVKPVPNYEVASSLLAMALTLEDRYHWGACEFDLLVYDWLFYKMIYNSSNQLKMFEYMVYKEIILRVLI